MQVASWKKHAFFEEQNCIQNDQMMDLREIQKTTDLAITMTTIKVIGVEQNVHVNWTFWWLIPMRNILISLEHILLWDCLSKDHSEHTDFHREIIFLDVRSSCMLFETLERCKRSTGASSLKISRRTSNEISINFESPLFPFIFPWIDSISGFSIETSFPLEAFCFFEF